MSIRDAGSVGAFKTFLQGAKCTFSWKRGRVIKIGTEEFKRRDLYVILHSVAARSFSSASTIDFDTAKKEFAVAQELIDKTLPRYKEMLKDEYQKAGGLKRLWVRLVKFVSGKRIKADINIFSGVQKQFESLNYLSYEELNKLRKTLNLDKKVALVVDKRMVEELGKRSEGELTLIMNQNNPFVDASDLMPDTGLLNLAQRALTAKRLEAERKR
jgi:hypothetical protein